MIVKLLTDSNLECISLKGATEARLSLHMSKYHIVGNHIHWLNYTPYHSCMLSYLLQTMVKQYTTCLLVLLLLTSALGSRDIRRNLRPRRGPRSADMRVGLCRFILSEHTRCYVCARLYNSVELYKDCCNRSQTNILTESCLKL